MSEEEIEEAVAAERARFDEQVAILTSRVASEQLAAAREPVRPVPASIHKATIQVMKATRKIAHDAENNQDGGYTYASVDAIYEALHEAMAEAGLLVIALEDKVERFLTASGKPAINCEFSFVLSTETDTWEVPGRLKRTVALLYRGAQSHQSAQSFAEKAFLRSWFKLSTGEKDDAEEQVQPEDKVPAKKAPKKVDPVAYAEEVKRLGGLMRSTKTRADLARVVEDNSGFQHLGEKERTELRSVFKAHDQLLAKGA